MSSEKNNHPSIGVTNYMGNQVTLWTKRLQKLKSKNTRSSSRFIWSVQRRWPINIVVSIVKCDYSSLSYLKCASLYRLAA